MKKYTIIFVVFLVLVGLLFLARDFQIKREQELAQQEGKPVIERTKLFFDLFYTSLDEKALDYVTVETRGHAKRALTALHNDQDYKPLSLALDTSFLEYEITQKTYSQASVRVSGNLKIRTSALPQGRSLEFTRDVDLLNEQKQWRVQFTKDFLKG